MSSARNHNETLGADLPEAPTARASLYIYLVPDAPPQNRSLAAVIRSISLRHSHVLPRRAQDSSHGNTADAPGDAVLAAYYLAAEQAPETEEPSYHLDREMQKFSAWLDDQDR